eukprot:CAMPEP_0172428502 /NCGR_PEP_ID=MMETSP1064-20121228/46634_1 /TAXON_ID=202472 /ORGANISM="Aulacoseira subarctica , Strain CCAP 1002/5" /LENGTH=333 /DNA_ID=CAMNT_0013173325 /DNA_START=148 /DNA_END=1149 /DNA_ORIENTATION=+
MVPVSITLTSIPISEPPLDARIACSISASNVSLEQFPSSSVGSSKVEDTCISTGLLQSSALDVLYSSTGTDAENPSIKAASSSDLSSSPITKKVRFACSSTDQVHFVLSRKQLSFKERNKTWWTQADLDYLRRMQRQVVDNAVRTGNGKVLSNIFLAENEQKLDDEDLKKVQDLIIFFQEDYGRRGLERLCNQMHKQERLKARKKAVSYVLEQQCNIELKDALVKEYGILTRSAKEFALTMARVDEFVAHGRFLLTASDTTPPSSPAFSAFSPASPVPSIDTLESSETSSTNSPNSVLSKQYGTSSTRCNMPSILVRLATSIVIVSREQKKTD